MSRKIAILVILIICIFTLSSCANSNTIDTSYEKAYFNLEEQYYELEDKYYEVYADNDEYGEYSLDLIQLYTDEVIDAFALVDEVRYQGYIADETEFYDALDTISEFYDSVYDISIDLDLVPVS